jgi:2,4-dienoyl-CoA reductase-like NADH-dependent reductase (Old Yellow Enzyme family)/NADH dehydrogenase FAD-containing subunit
MAKSNRQFRELLRPGHIGSMELKNRLIMAPMGTYLADRSGLITDRLKSYYEERASGGAGLLIAGVASVDHPRGKVMTRQIGISDDKFIPGLAALAEVVHRHGAGIALQLQHGGRIAAPFLSGGHESVSASVVPLVPEELGLTRELSVPEISRLVQCFAGAAGRAQQAGIDGVEIHAGHGYLINQFLSRSTNKRRDDYGGELVKRARFLLEIIRAVRETVGVKYPVWCRVDGQEFTIKDGLTRQETQEVVRMAENAGVDAIHVSGYGGSHGGGFTEAPLVQIPGYLVPLAQEIKKIIKVPVIAVGRIDPVLGEKILRRGDADFIAMGRPLLADPELPHKIAAGKIEDIRKCIYCYTCVHQIFVRNNVCCTVNPGVGKESEPPAGPPARSKKVMVAGGGPAGLEAAAVAALRGHRVFLYEKEKHLGGSLRFASIVREENEDLVKYLTGRIKKLDIQTVLGQKVTPELVEQLKPDVLILATGSVRHSPPVPGIDGKNVINGDGLRRMLHGQNPQLVRWLSRFWMPLGKRVAVMGGGMVGCELAVFLAERGRIVTILESSDQLAPEMSLPLKWITLDKLQRNGVITLTEVKYEEITPRGVRIQSKDGTRKMLAADTIVVAAGTEPDREIQVAFQGKAPEIYLAGDCSKMSFIRDSIAEGARISSVI